MGESLSSGEPPASFNGWSAPWSDARVVVLGLGETGFSAADTLAELGAHVTVITREATTERIELAGILGVDVRCLPDASHAEAVVAVQPDLVVVSPGWAPSHPAVTAARDAGVPVWGDVELAWRLRDKSGTPSEWAFVSGGTPARRQRVATLAAGMLQAAGVRVAPAGSGGVSLLDAIRDPGAFRVLVIALTDQQLAHLPVPAPDDDLSEEGIPAPVAAAALRAVPAPADSKDAATDATRALAGRVFHRVKVACVYDLGAERTREWVEDATVFDGARAIGVGVGIPGPSDLGVVDGVLVDRAFLEDRRTHALELGSVDKLPEPDREDAESVHTILTAAALARALGAPPAAVAAIAHDASSEGDSDAADSP